MHNATGGTESGRRDTLWASGPVYESYVGRWSRRVAPPFIEWLGLPPAGRWCDVGCGTGALTSAVLDGAAPHSMVSVDPSPAFITHAREQVRDPRVRFELGDARALPFADGAFDAIVSGLVLNFVPQPEQVVLEMNRVTRPGGTVATYVWDYTGKMEMKRHFWDAAAALDPAARELDEGLQYALCKAGPIGNLFRGAGLGGIDVRAIDVPTHFQDFDDYWSPFLGGQAPAPRYAMSLDEERRTALRERVRSNLPFAPDGSIHLVARAWAVRGRNAPPAASGSGNVSPVRR